MLTGMRATVCDYDHKTEGKLHFPLTADSFILSGFLRASESDKGKESFS